MSKNYATIHRNIIVYKNNTDSLSLLYKGDKQTHCYIHISKQ